MNSASRLLFSSRFFLLSLVVLSFTYLTSLDLSALTISSVKKLAPQIMVQKPVTKTITIKLLGDQAVRVGQTAEFLAIINTAGQPVQAVDTVLEYDPAFLQFVDILPNRLLGEQIPLVQKENRLYFSAVASDQNSFIGSGELAAIRLKALKPGKTEVKIIFSPKDTVDSNVILANDTIDALGAVTNITFNIL